MAYYRRSRPSTKVTKTGKRIFEKAVIDIGGIEVETKLSYRAVAESDIPTSSEGTLRIASPITVGSFCVITPMFSYVKVAPLSGSLSVSPTTFRCSVTLPKDADRVASYEGRSARLHLYRTKTSLWDTGLFRLQSGSMLQRMQAFLNLESAIVIMFQTLPEAYHTKFEKVWNRFQKLKALALAPGTSGEGNAAAARAAGAAQSCRVIAEGVN